MDPQTEQQDLLTLEETLVRASTGKRFFNYLIDVILFYVLLFLVAMAISAFAPSTLENNDRSPGFNLLDRIIALVFYGTYMGIIEGLFKGKSLGKLITRTRAVNLDGTTIGWGKAFARGFCRAVPFCAFSAFGAPCNPWQDSWTSTMVVDETKLIG